MAGQGFSELGNSLLNSKGQANYSSIGSLGKRIAYPAIVVNTDDPAEQNRIVARIVTLTETGEIKGGRDRDTPDDKLPLCIPIQPEFLHIRPLKGEMVIVLLENPEDNSAPRYWFGPIISSKLKLRNQPYGEAIKIFDHTDFFTNRRINDKISTALAFPSQADIALQGRDDSDLILRPREVYLTAGKFNKNSFDLNVSSPCFFQLKQLEDSEKKEFSQANLNSVNINIYSPEGKFRKKEDASKTESNPDLEKFGDLAATLHPAAFGDQLIVVLDLIIRVLLTHIHTPQKPMLAIPESETLKEYTLLGKLQDLISYHVRIN